MPTILQLAWTVPDETFDVGCDEGNLLTQMQEAMVMRLLQAQRITQGKAAELLGVTRHG